MKTAGIIGGMSWESTIPYYQEINHAVQKKLGGLHSAPLIIFSVDFSPLAIMQENGDWDGIAGTLSGAARSLQQGGADFVLLATNTMHQVADRIEEAVSIPFVHIADVTGARILERGMKKVGLLGTAFTMEQEFYRSRLLERFGIEAIIPAEGDRRFVHGTIYNELCCGRFLDSSRKEFLRIIGELSDRGAEGIILGCTEIPLLVTSEHTDIPLFDTGRIHAEAAVEMILEGKRLSRVQS
ncbi:MAG: aspartate/glutamate racemase family protein [Proteobacteria bacterium]|nr:aspartate/glutamate racemase family protein [Pseudomonadota bacterium]